MWLVSLIFLCCASAAERKFSSDYSPDVRLHKHFYNSNRKSATRQRLKLLCFNEKLTKGDLVRTLDRLSLSDLAACIAQFSPRWPKYSLDGYYTLRWYCLLLSSQLNINSFLISRISIFFIIILNKNIFHFSSCIIFATEDLIETDVLGRLQWFINSWVK